MSNRSVLKWAYDDVENVTGVAKAVLCYLAFRVEKGMDARPSMPQISRCIGHGDMAVRNAIKELIAAELVEVEAQTVLGGRCTRNEYRLNVGHVVTQAKRPKGSGSKCSPPPTPTKSRGLNLWGNPHEIEGVNPHEIAGVTPSKSKGLNPHEIEGAYARAYKDESLCTGNPVSSDSSTPTLPVVTDSTGTLLRNADAASLAPAPAPAEPIDVRKQVWTEGVSIVRRLTGKLDGSARKQIGVFLRDAQDDCTVVIDVLRAAEREGPYEPIPWVRAGIAARLSDVPKFRDAGCELGYRLGLFTPEARAKERAGLSVDHSDFLREAAHG